MIKRITVEQVKQIAVEISNRWKFVNHGCFYNCIDTKTGQQSIQGGKFNFASYNFLCRVETMYLSFIGENHNYFDWQTYGVSESLERKEYIFNIKNEIVKILCGFEKK